MSDYKCTEGCSLTPNELEILYRQVKRELRDLTVTTEAKLLCHDRKNS